MKISLLIIGVSLVLSSCHLLKSGGEDSEGVEQTTPSDEVGDTVDNPEKLPDDVVDTVESTLKIEYFLSPLSEIIDAAIKDDKLIMLFFSAEWCKPCKVYKSVTFEEPDTKTYLVDNYIIKYLDVETDFDGIEFHTKYKVKNLPTLVFLNHKGEEVNRIVGHLSGYSFLRNITEIREAN